MTCGHCESSRQCSTDLSWEQYGLDISRQDSLRSTLVDYCVSSDTDSSPEPGLGLCIHKHTESNQEILRMICVISFDLTLDDYEHSRVDVEGQAFVALGLGRLINVSLGSWRVLMSQHACVPNDTWQHPPIPTSPEPVYEIPVTTIHSSSIVVGSELTAFYADDYCKQCCVRGL